MSTMLKYLYCVTAELCSQGKYLVYKTEAGLDHLQAVGLNKPKTSSPSLEV